MSTDAQQRTAADAFTEADAKLEQLEAKLGAAQADVEALSQAKAKKHSEYRSGLARTELDGAPVPSRADLESTERDLADAEDRVVGLEEAVRQFRPEWARAKADMLLERAAAIRAEGARRQARIHEIQEGFKPGQQEIAEHAGWINTELLKAQQLEAEALQT